MRAVRRKDTAPEIAVRKVLHASGLRYRLHARDLPGSPDIVLPGRHTVVFVHGCFWHGHGCAHGSVKSKTNIDFWTGKISANRRRDVRNRRALQRLGWRVETVWECRAFDVVHVRRLADRLLSR